MNQDKIVSCPYDNKHTMIQSRFISHLTKGCDAKKKFGHLFTSCPNNTLHIVKKQNLDYHLSDCPDRSKNNKFTNEDKKIKQEMLEAVRIMNNSRIISPIDNSLKKTTIIPGQKVVNESESRSKKNKKQEKYEEQKNIEESTKNKNYKKKWDDVQIWKEQWEMKEDNKKNNNEYKEFFIDKQESEFEEKEESKIKEIDFSI